MTMYLVRMTGAVAVAVLVLATGAAAAPAPPSGDHCPLTAALVPDCAGGVHWGVYTLRGETPAAAVTALERRVGRPFDVVLRYHDFSDRPGPGEFPDQYEHALGERRLLFLAWESRLYREDTDLRWSDIAAGAYDDVIRAGAERIAAYPDPLFLSFDPEMDRLTDRKGTPEEYVAAARRVRSLLDAAGADNVVWVWTVTGWLGEGNEELMRRSYPGDGYVDWVGYDPYNFYRCHGKDRPWKTFERTVGPFYDWAMRHGFGDKPFFIPEYGTQFDPADPARSRAFYDDIPQVLRARPNIKALIRWDSGFGCELHLDNGPGMVDAFAETGKHLQALREDAG